MKRLLLMSLVAVFALLSLGEVCGQDYTGSVLPSEQTTDNFSRLPSEATVPELRAKPGDIDGSEKPQKVPVGDVKIEIVLMLASLMFIYTTYRTQKRRSIEL